MGLFDWLKKNSIESIDKIDSKASANRQLANRNWQEEKNKKWDKLIAAQNAVGERKHIADGIIYDIDSTEITLNTLNVKIYEWLGKDGNSLDDYSIRDQFDIEKELSALSDLMINHRVPKEKYQIFFINEFCFIQNKHRHMTIQPFYGKFKLKDGTEVVVKTGQLLSEEAVKYDSKIQQAHHEFGIKSIEELGSEQKQEFFKRIQDLSKLSSSFAYDIINSIKCSKS